ncbi:replication protein, partial [Xanthomonas euvesicatoria]
RRAAGAVDRETYLDAAQAKRKQAQALKAEGLSVRVIAQRMGVSVGSVAGYLKAPQERSRSVRITADQSSIGAGIAGTADSAQHDVQSPSVLLMAEPRGRDLRA